MIQFSYAKILRVSTFVILDFITNVEPRIVNEAHRRHDNTQQTHLITSNIAS